MNYMTETVIEHFMTDWQESKQFVAKCLEPEHIDLAFSELAADDIDEILQDCEELLK